MTESGFESAYLGLIIVHKKGSLPLPYYFVHERSLSADLALFKFCVMKDALHIVKIFQHIHKHLELFNVLTHYGAG